jgi:peptidoglycan/xylan/chitin deacetylase (PgdA/CDA1 family)
MRSGVYIKTLNRNPKAGNVVALTFDDGPDPVQTLKILDILKEHDIQACFFSIGRKITGNEDIIRRMKAEGHLVGNHSFAHSNKFPLYSLKRMIADLKACGDELARITGCETSLFRPPYGVSNPTIARAVKKMKYTVIGWNIRTFDTCSGSIEKIVKRVDKKLSPGSVILLHDTMDFSDILLKSILAMLKQRCYKVISIDELFNFNF